MEFDNSFEVPLPPGEAWKVLLDIRGIAPCMPGAELTEVVSANTYKGRINVRLGPVALTFAGLVKFDAIDEANHTARVSAQGTDAKGRGGAQATSVFHLEPAGNGSKVLVHTNLNLSGAVAQYGRGVGIIQATSAQLMNQFAKALREKLEQSEALPTATGSPAAQAAQAVSSVQPSPASATAGPSVSATPPAAKPIGGFALLAKAVWNWFVGLFRRS
jgi:carbon monoxide dehydrogenase subunit G